MRGNVHLLDLLIILGAVQGIIFAIYLWFKPLKNKPASKFLSLFILSFALNSLYFTSESIGLRGHLDPWTFLPFYCSFLIITSFYYFVKYLVFPHKKFTKFDLLIFIPAILQVLYQCLFLIWSITDREGLLKFDYVVYTMSDIIDVGVIIMAVVFLLLILKMLHQYQNKLLDRFSEIEDFSLNWLKILIYSTIGLLILFMIPAAFEILTDHRMFNIYYPLWISSSILIYWIGYSTWIRNQKVVPEEAEELNSKDVSLSDNTKQYHEHLMRSMLDDKMYLKQDLSLKTLAKALGISSGYLSQIINQYEQKNFFEFVNSFRVEEVKKKILDAQYSHLSILGIAFESGFKSKSTFNLAFKKLEGITPTAFKKQNSNKKTS